MKFGQVFAIPVIAQKAARAYLALMASALIRLAALVAVLLMPIGMASAPAMAQPAPAAGGHCDGHQDPAEAPSKPQAHCMACSALPAMDAPAPAEAMVPKMPRLLARVAATASIVPEIATPPPKLA